LNLRDVAGDGDGSYSQPPGFTVIIPLQDLVVIHCFEDWPSFLGDITAKFFITEKSMAYTSADPLKVLNEVCLANNQSTVTESEANVPYPYDHKFHQIGTSGLPIRTVDFDGVGLAGRDVTTVTNFQCTECYCNTYGHGLAGGVIKQLYSMITPENPPLIPTHFIYPKDFGYGTANGIDSDFSTALHNVSDVIIVFPEDPQDLTCYEDPMLNNLQLNIDNGLCPEKAVSTIGGRFFQMMLSASDLGGAFECTNEYEESLTRPLNPDDGECCEGPYKDQTCFICTTQTERNAEGCFSDGLETGNASARVAIHGDPICLGEDNTYWTPDP
jgi:hypothetical protein